MKHHGVLPIKGSSSIPGACHVSGITSVTNAALWHAGDHQGLRGPLTPDTPAGAADPDQAPHRPAPAPAQAADLAAGL